MDFDDGSAVRPTVPGIIRQQVVPYEPYSKGMNILRVRISFANGELYEKDSIAVDSLKI
jgi:hypothetical protein